MNEAKEIFVINDRCMGCHSCELACAVAHSRAGELHAALLSKETPRPVPRLYVEALASARPVPILCRHCEEAPCLHACIAGAIRKSGHTVVTDQDKCIGCWTCVMVCPYGVVGRHPEDQKAYRCDRCPTLAEPACVTACPTGALVYRSVETFSRERRRKAAAEQAAGRGD